MSKAKKTILTLLFIVLASSFSLFAACGGAEGTDPSKNNYDMSGAAWNYAEAFTYDGTEKSVAVTGLPEGVTVKSYTDNKKTAAGEYTAKAVFEYDAENYNAPVLADCKWKIEKAQITGLSLESKTVDYDGNKKSLTVTGTLPAGVTVTYTYNGATADGATEIGNYAVKATAAGDNYVTWQAEAELKIRQKANLANLAKTVMDAFGNVPDFMDYLPQTYGKENRVLTAPITYDSPVSVAALPVNGMGKQLHTVYNTLIFSDTALGYVSNIYGGFSAIANLYQEYINRNPDNYKLFEGEWNGFGIRIELADEEYILMAKGVGVAVELYQSVADDRLTARIDIADKAAIKIVSDGGKLRLAVNAAGLFTSDLDFARDDETGVVTGVLYETTGVGNARLTTCTILTVTQTHLIVVGNKGDFVVPGQGVNVEVYDNTTGCLCGTEVYETVKVVDYDTLWYGLPDMSGITSVSAVMGQSHEDNKLNKDTVYINGKDTPFVPVYNSKLGIKTSRQYDIEFKTMYFFTYDSVEDKYTLTEQLIPMLFVQRENLDTYLDDIASENSLSSVANNSSATDNAVIAAAYDAYTPVYNDLKAALSYEDTIAFIGGRNVWFEKEEEIA